MAQRSRSTTQGRKRQKQKAVMYALPGDDLHVCQRSDLTDGAVTVGRQVVH